MTSDFLVAAVQATLLGLPRSNRSQVAAWKLEIQICNLCVEDFRKNFSQIISWLLIARIGRPIGPVGDLDLISFWRIVRNSSQTTAKMREPTADRTVRR